MLYFNNRKGLYWRFITLLQYQHGYISFFSMEEIFLIQTIIFGLIRLYLKKNIILMKRKERSKSKFAYYYQQEMRVKLSLKLLEVS